MPTKICPKPENHSRCKCEPCHGKNTDVARVIKPHNPHALTLPPTRTKLIIARVYQPLRKRKRWAKEWGTKRISGVSVLVTMQPVSGCVSLSLQKGGDSLG